MGGFNLPDGVNTSDIPGFRKEDYEADEKIKRFLRLPEYDQIKFWKEYADDYMEVLHKYIMNNFGEEIDLAKIARYLYDMIDDAEYYITSDWRE